MNEQIDWGKAPADAEYWCEMQFFKTVNGEWMVWCPGLGSWIDPAYKAPDNFSWWGNAVARPTTPSWSGEGLPPVGVVCEFQSRGEMWEPVKVFSVQYNHDESADILFTHAEGWGYVDSNMGRLRPIRTPEQIASDEREAAIKEIQREIMPAHEYTAELILDAVTRLGYRKP